MTPAASSSSLLRPNRCRNRSEGRALILKACWNIGSLLFQSTWISASFPADAFPTAHLAEHPRQPRADQRKYEAGYPQVRCILPKAFLPTRDMAKRHRVRLEQFL